MSQQHNFHYVVFFSIATNRAFAIAGDALCRSPLYKSESYLHWYDREYRRGAQCPFAENNMSLQRDAESCAETPCPLIRRRSRKEL